MFLPGLVLLVCFWSPVEPACDPVEEGQPTTLTCNVNTAGRHPSNQTLEWRTQTTSLATVIFCLPDKCNGRYSPYPISATLSPTNSTLTINRVSRADPFNMETKWLCQPYIGNQVTVCDKLPVYAKPSSPSCRVIENSESGEIISVTVTCSTDKVYPEAKCSFYTIKNEGQPVQITQTPTYRPPTTTSTTPVYYSSECSVNVSVQELGEGGHRFQGFIYPDVTGGQSLVTGITPNHTVTLGENIKEDSVNTTAIVIGIIALVVLATSVLIIAFLVRRIQNMENKRSEGTTDPDLNLIPIDTPDIVNNVQTPEVPRPGQHEDVDGVQNTTGSTTTLTGLTSVSRQDRDANDTLPHTHISMVSASCQTLETDYYEVFPCMTPTSGPYNSLSAQNVEAPNIYRRLIPDNSSTRHDTPSGDYINIIG